MTTLAVGRHLSGSAIGERFTRVRALMSRVLGPAWRRPCPSPRTTAVRHLGTATFR